MELEILYVKGDATKPVGEGDKVIVHICNDIGAWGAGFVLAISKRWKEPERFYRESFKASEKPSLGDVQFIRVDDDIVVANIIGQKGVRTRSTKVTSPIRYLAVRQGLEAVARYTSDYNASVHMPRIGCGLAGGNWMEIEKIISETLLSKGIKTTVYDLY